MRAATPLLTSVFHAGPAASLLRPSRVTDFSVASARSVLRGYRNRYAALKDAVTETEPSFREDLLGEIAVVDLLTAPVHELADRWRH